MRFAIPIYLLVFFALISTGAAATDAYTLPAELARTELFPALSIALDEQGDWSLRDAMQARFHAPIQSRWGFPQKKQILWTKVSIANPLPEHVTVIFDTGDFAEDYVTQYVVDTQSGELLAQARAGVAYPAAKRDIKSHNIAFPLTIRPNHSVDVYLRIQSKTRIQLAPALYSLQAFQQEEHTYDVATYLCYGGLVALILYHLLVSLYSREPESMYFIAFMIIWGAYSALLEGLLQPLIPAQWIAKFRSDYDAAAVIFPVLALAAFTANYLQQLKTRLCFRWLLVGICAATAIASAITFVAWLPFQQTRIAIILCIVTAVIIHAFIFGVLAVDGHKTARFYFAGALLMLFFLLFAARVYTANTGLFNNAGIWMRLSFIAPLLCFAAGHGQRINELRMQNYQSAQRATLAIEQAEFKSDFLAKMSHEIRSPMNGILGPVELLHMTSLTEEQTKYVNIIAKSGNVLLDVVNEILDYSKLEAGKLALSLSTFSLHELIADCATAFSVHPKHRLVQLSIEFTADLPNYVEGDVHRLRQVLLNLIGNAFKFTERGSVQLSARQLNKTSSNNDMIEFLVRDPGIGINSEDLPKLFAEYQQVGSERNNTTGTGLGLAICHQLVELMGGTISVSSQLGVGSTFRFQIPLKVTANNPALS